MPEWQIIISATTDQVLTGDETAALVDGTGGGGNLAFTSPPGSIDHRFTVEAAGALQAGAAGGEAWLAACRAAGVNADVRELRVMSREDYDAGRLYRDSRAGVAEIAQILGVTRQRAQQLTRRSDFPAFVEELASGHLWDRAQVAAFGRTWKRQTGRPRKAASPPQ